VDYPAQPMRTPVALLTAVSLTVALAACGSGGGDANTSDAPSGGASPDTGAASTAAPAPAPTAKATTGGCRTVKAPDTSGRTVPKPTSADALPKGAKATVLLQTSCGPITIQLDTAKQPKTASTFAYLVKKKFYDGLPFHRIAGQPGQDFVIQGGAPGGAPDGGPGWSVQEKPPADAAYTRGVVAMAKTGDEPAGTSGSQFFIVTGQDVGLPPDYAIAGKVVGGDQTVSNIAAVHKDSSDVPLSPVLIEKATLTTK
jgi:peptidyl-prolyl cis-trans isomerase B (cyclophilin B)